MSLGDKFARIDDSLHKLDGKLQRGLNNSFAFFLGGKLVASEIEQTLRGEMEENITQQPGTQVDDAVVDQAPNSFTARVSGKDFAHLSQENSKLPANAADMLTRFARSQGWQLQGPVTVTIVEDSSLRTGQLNCASAVMSSPTTPSSYIAANGGMPATVDSDAGASKVPMVETVKTPDSAAGAYRPQPHRSPDAQPYVDSSWGQPAADHSAAGEMGSTTATPQESSPVAGQQHAASPTQQDVNWDEFAALTAGTAGAAGGYGVAAANMDAKTTAFSRTEEYSEPHYQPPTVTLLLQDGSSRSYLVMEGSNIIGRGSDADFRLPDTGVSRRHAEIIWDGIDAVLVDLQSTNGTLVGDVPIDNWLLADGDVITIGHSYIEVRITGGQQ
ncbi:FHA domain-containing protein FhaA [Corynebacterium choanae]|uniref:FHA domain-containing protein FhaA n=2 Tax=Corynebacterium choanae TaxID=1862358 RepID=A0A3G6J7P7_9CORY|nr:FHA domain-containing protein FhaA [Corynebacterium choanae]